MERNECDWENMALARYLGTMSILYRGSCKLVVKINVVKHLSWLRLKSCHPSSPSRSRLVVQLLSSSGNVSMIFVFCCLALLGTEVSVSTKKKTVHSLRFDTSAVDPKLPSGKQNLKSKKGVSVIFVKCGSSFVSTLPLTVLILPNNSSGRMQTP